MLWGKKKCCNWIADNLEMHTKLQFHPLHVCMCEYNLALWQNKYWGFFGHLFHFEKKENCCVQDILFSSESFLKISIHYIKIECEDHIVENLNSVQNFIHLHFYDRTGSQSMTYQYVNNLFMPIYFFCLLSRMRMENMYIILEWICPEQCKILCTLVRYPLF